MKSADVILRKALASDEPFLWEMLYHSLYVPAGGTPFSREILSKPEIAKYLKGWGRSGDMALIAVDANSHQPIGAAWMRIFSGPQKGYGYVADGTPELGIAVLPEHRRRGIGSVLLQRLIEIATSSHDALSLSVSSDNPAQRLYQRAGFERVGSSGNSITMLKRLK
jgi:ribosomal protein S18 acetylase RimI-like enzyme